MKTYVHVIAGLSTGGAEIAMLNWLKSDQHSKHIVLTLQGGNLLEELQQYCDVRLVSIVSLFVYLFKIRTDENKAIFCWMYHASVFCMISKILFNFRNPCTISLHHSDTSLSGLGWKSYISSRIIAKLSVYKEFHFKFCGYHALHEHCKLGIPYERCNVLHNIIDLNGRATKKNEYRPHVEKFLFVGRWHKVKNIPNLLKLVALFSEQKKISLTMVGSDLDEKNQELVNLVDTMGLTGITELVGYTRDVTSFYSTHDCLIISSKTESYPNVAVEALVNGCRVLASDVGDTKLIVGEAGVIIDYDDNIMRNSLTTSVFQKLESITEEQINTQANILLERHAAKTFLRTIELQKKVNIDVE